MLLEGAGGLLEELERTTKNTHSPADVERGALMKERASTQELKWEDWLRPGLCLWHGLRWLTGVMVRSMLGPNYASQRNDLGKKICLGMIKPARPEVAGGRNA